MRFETPTCDTRIISKPTITHPTVHTHHHQPTMKFIIKDVNLLEQTTIKNKSAKITTHNTKTTLEIHEDGTFILSKSRDIAIVSPLVI
jgi:hypothetical protein